MADKPTPEPSPLGARAIELQRELMEHTDPAHRARVHVELGVLALRERKPATAVRHFREALKLDPRSQDAARRLADLVEREAPAEGRLRGLLRRISRRETRD